MRTHLLSRTLVIAAAASSLLFTAACGGEPRSTLADAEAAFEQRELRIARAHLADIFANGEPDERTYLLQMRVMLELGDGHAAMAALERISDGVLGPSERRVAKAHAYILQGNPHKAADIYEDLELAEFSEKDFQMALVALRDMNEMDEFTAGMDAALEAYPKSAPLNALAGDILIDLGEAEEAEAYAKRAFETDPKGFDTLLLMGRIAIADGDFEKGLAHYQDAHKLYPYHPVSQANIAGLQLDLGKVEEAGRTLDRALADHPEFPFLQWQKARHALLTGDNEAARGALENARRTYRNNDDFTLLSAQIEEKLGNRKLALFEYRRYLRAVGSDREVEARIEKLES